MADRPLGVPSAFRLVHGEADLLPSLIVDRYGDYLVLQALSQGMDRLAPTLVRLLVELTHYVMRDEARHVAFGVLSLDGYYREMSSAELRDREDDVPRRVHGTGSETSGLRREGGDLPHPCKVPMPRGGTPAHETGGVS